MRPIIKEYSYGKLVVSDDTVVHRPFGYGTTMRSPGWKEITKDDSHPAGQREPSHRTKIEMAAGWLASRKTYTPTLTEDDLLAQYKTLKTALDIVKAKKFLDDQFNPDKQQEMKDYQKWIDRMAASKTELDIVKAKKFLDDQFNPDKQRG